MIGSWWTYLVFYLFLVLAFKLIEHLRVIRLRKQFLSEDDETCVCETNKHIVQLSVVVKAPEQEGAWNRFENALHSLLGNGFDTMEGAYYKFTESPVATYMYTGENEEDSKRLFSEIQSIMEQEEKEVPEYHLIMLKELGVCSATFAFRTLKQIDKLKSW